MSARLGVPPADIPPERLWRFLLQRRPERPLRFRIPGIAHPPLLVRAVPALQIELAVDAAVTAAKVTEAQGTLLACGVVAATVVAADDGEPFFSVDLVQQLLPREFNTLALEVLGHLDAICPTYARSDIGAWRVALEKGAAHDSNFHLAHQVAACADPIVSMALKEPVWREHPERYWGVPVGALLDGHWMAFRAARTVTSRPTAGST